MLSPNWLPIAVLASSAWLATSFAVEVKLEHDGLTLNGSLAAESGAWPTDPVVLMVHGTLAHNEMEIMATLQELFSERGVASLAVTLGLGIDDRRGMYDCATAHVHEHTDALAEIGAWLAWLEDQGVRETVLLGHSRGGNQAAWFAAERESPLLRKLVLVAPSTWSFERAASEYEGRFGKPLAPLLETAQQSVDNGNGSQQMEGVGFLRCRDALVTAASFVSYYGPDERHDTAALLRDLPLPVLVFAGSADEVVVGLDQTLAPLAESGRIELETIDGADHFFRDLYAEDLVDRSVEFIRARQSSPNPYGEITVPFSVGQIPGRPVYYVTGFPGVPGSENNGHTSNAGFVITKEGVVVYDALGTPALGYALLQAIRARTDKPVKKVIVGHYHADHIYGLQAFAEHTRGEIWANDKAWDYVGREDDPESGATARMRLAQRREALFPWVDEDTYIVAPQRTFDAGTGFRLGDVEFLVRHMGPAHSPTDAILMVPAYGVVFSGDLVFEGRVPFLDSPFVNTESWISGLEYLRSMEPPPEYLVPGHGPVSRAVRERIAFTLEYLHYLRAEMGRAAEELMSFDEAYPEVDWSRYRGLPAFEESNRRNAYRVFLEMEAEVLE